MTCDVPGCLAVWHYAGEREHASGRHHDWLHVFLSGLGVITPPALHERLDFCPEHARTAEALRVIGARLTHSTSTGGI